MAAAALILLGGLGLWWTTRDKTPDTPPVTVAEAPETPATPEATIPLATAAPGSAAARPAPPPPAPVRPAGGPLRVFCEARLEPRLFKKTKEKDVRDSTKDLKGAFDDHDRLELVEGQDKAMGFNTWKGAAKGALKQAEEWLEATLDAPPPH